MPSKSAKKAAEGEAIEVTGDITIHGVTKSITVKLERTGLTTGGRPLIGFEGTFTINRADFDMKEMLEMVGNDVRITISLEAGRR